MANIDTEKRVNQEAFHKSQETRRQKAAMANTQEEKLEQDSPKARTLRLNSEIDPDSDLDSVETLEEESLGAAPNRK